MTPQSNFMVLAPIASGREAELRALLATMNRSPGVVDPQNSLVPFGQFPGLHFARFIILDDPTTVDITTGYGLPAPAYPVYLSFLGDYDGVNEYFPELTLRAGDGLRRIFSHCEGFSPATDLTVWMKQHNLVAATSYVNWLGRTVQQVREEDALRQNIEAYLQQNAAGVSLLSARQVHQTLRRHVIRQQQAGRLTLTDPQPAPFGWQIRNLLHAIFVPLLLLLAAPFLLLYLPFFIFQLRRREKSDMVIAPRIDPAHASELASIEDFDVTNQFNAFGSLKPGLFRRWLTVFILWVINYTTRHIYTRGRLARVNTIHFARWVFLDGRRRVYFASNYDGSLDSYMDDFINKVGFGLNIVFSNGIAYPRTNWLLLDGAKDEQKFKYVLRRHEGTTEAWYRAHPGLTALDMDRNSRIRTGIETPAMNDAQLHDWIRLL